MCFSANASFGAGIILGAIGVVAIKKADNFPRHLFATIPLLFSIQQFCEGFLWLALTHSAYASWQQILTYIFLVFAYVVWPIWIPLTIILLEKNRQRKKILSILLITGIFISFYIAYCLLLYPIHVSLTSYHVQYNFDYPDVLPGLTWLSDAFYFIATILPPFISTLKKMRILGVVIIGSYVVSKIFFNDSIISMWCYFATALSIIVLLIIMGLKKSHSQFLNTT